VGYSWVFADNALKVLRIWDFASGLALGQRKSWSVSQLGIERRNSVRILTHFSRTIICCAGSPFGRHRSFLLCQSLDTCWSIRIH
jgi:hypothetical protein